MPSEIRFTIIRKTLEDHGWRLDRVKGSHHVFTKPGADTVSIPVHNNKVKPRYVRKVQKLIEEQGD
ncbi:type II toxin-antitoxin system HicA family toxin [Planctomycetales bacterium ZRK34]|nr:type II toxin-antitoxin system HicA family toxin [Planctomycetales bacterium ZRK34]